MKKVLKILLSLLCMVVLVFSTVACGNTIGSSNDSEQGASFQEEQKDSKDDKKAEKKYANVAGYPIEKGDLELHKMFINGQEYFLIAYTHKDDPEHLYFSPTPAVYDLNGNGVGVSSGNKSAWAFNFGDSFAVMTKDNPTFNIDGELYTDVAPEDYDDEKYGKSWYCGTVFLEKMLDAEVHFSADRSAVYLVTNKTVTKEATENYDLKVTAEGLLTAKNKTDGSEVRLKVDGSDPGVNVPGKSNSKSGSNNNSKPVESRITCTRCGGSGSITTSENVYNPATKGYEMRSKSTPCPNCGGRGYTTIYR